MIAFGRALPKIRRTIARDLARPGLAREKVLATVVRLLEMSLIRVGNEEYARDNGSFGLTTLRDRHVDIDGATLHFEFRGKSGKRHVVDVTDRKLARVVGRCQELPGHELFQYVDERGLRHRIDSADVNDYLQRISSEEFTAKDFRTWVGTACAIEAFQWCGPARGRAAVKRKIAQAIDRVAARLGNTRSVCLKCYVHPAVIEAYSDGALDFEAHPTDSAIVRFLRRRRAPLTVAPASP